MNTIVSIQPVQFYPITANYLDINDVYVDLNAQTANAQVTFLDSGQNAIPSSAQRWFMNSGTYQGWAGDDQYFINACVAGLGLTPAS